VYNQAVLAKGRMERKDQEQQLALPIDVREQLFHNVLRDARFQAWTQICRRWQLHIDGGPGNGKVSQLNEIHKAVSECD
jgi:hypothetical protein